MSNSDSYSLIPNTSFNTNVSDDCVSYSGSEYTLPGIMVNPQSVVDANYFDHGYDTSITFGNTVLTEELLIKLQALLEMVENHPELSKELDATLAFRKLKK